jgi:hypothetical protein
MMRLLILTSIIFFFQISFGQEITQNTENFFVQVMLTKCNSDIYDQIEADLKDNPYIRLVRLDRHTKGLIVGTQNIQELNQSVFEAWLGEHSDKITCYYQGIHGVHTMHAFNEQFCSIIHPNH